MPLAAIFDTETTGLVRWDMPSTASQQPSLCEVACSLVDLTTRETWNSMSLIVRPDGWTIPQGASNVHGITTEKALKYGVALENVVYLFRDMVATADYLICHNSRFDRIVMERASAMIDAAEAQPVVGDLWRQDQQWICTMMAATPIVQKPSKFPKHKRDFKWPKLNEATQMLFGRDVSGAHRAGNDVAETINVLFALIDLGAINIAGVEARPGFVPFARRQHSQPVRVPA